MGRHHIQAIYRWGEMIYIWRAQHTDGSDQIQMKRDHIQMDRHHIQIRGMTYRGGGTTYR